MHARGGINGGGDDITDHCKGFTWEELALINADDAVGVRSILSLAEPVCCLGLQLRSVVRDDGCLAAVPIVTLHVVSS